jgi:serine/threonine-protein kinase
MAEVYLAEQGSLKRPVALKVLRRALAQDDGYVRRFLNEAQSAARLVHANIVQIYEIGCIDGLRFIAQEYVPGQNLQQLLARQGRPLDAVAVLAIMRQVAAALNRAAAENIIHRDIKPENILVAPSGEVKVADFGLARVADDREAMALTQVGITMGTPLYMSPEQAEGKTVDPRSDLYSFGATCYHLLTGHPPFTGETALAVAVQHVKADPEPLAEQRPDVPPELCELIHKLLAKKPAARLQSPSELLTALRAVKVNGVAEDWTTHLDFAISAASPELSRSHLEATQQLGRIMQAESRLFSVRRRRPWVALASLLLLALLGGSALAFLRPPKPLLVADAGPSPMVKRWETAEEQWFYARMLKNERAYQAVTQYFPPGDSAVNLRYSRLAQQDLAWLYREQQRFPEALKTYEDLSRVPPGDGPYALVGLAGQVIVHHQMGDLADHTELLFELLKKPPAEREAVLRDERLRGELLEIAKGFEGAQQRLTEGINLAQLPGANPAPPAGS